MAQVVKTNRNPNLTGKNPGSTSRSIDFDLQQRIRELLNSRNERNPARAPLPSPENFRRAPTFPSEDDTQDGSEPVIIPMQNAARKIRRQANPRLCQSEAWGSRFDGSDLFSKEGSNILTRPTSPESLVNASSTFDHCVPNKSDGLSRAESTTSKHQSDGQGLRYSLRVVSPKRTTQDDLDVRPSMMHIPGSYKSEDTSYEDAGAIDKSKYNPSSPRDRFKENVEFKDPQGIISGPPPSAAAALQKTRAQAYVNRVPHQLESTDPDIDSKQMSLQISSNFVAEPITPSRRSSLRQIVSQETQRPLSSSSVKINRCPQIDQDSAGRVSFGSRARSSLSGYSSTSHHLMKDKPLTTYSAKLPTEPSLTTRSSPKSKKRGGKGLSQATASEPKSGHSDEYAAPTLSQDSLERHNLQGHSITNPIDELEDLLAEAIQMVDNTKDPEPILVEKVPTLKQSNAKDRPTVCSCTPTSTSSFSGSDDERLQTRIPIKQRDERNVLHELMREEQMDGVPRFRPQHESPTHDFDRLNGANRSNNLKRNREQEPASKSTRRSSKVNEFAPIMANDWAYNQNSTANATLEPRKPTSAQQPIKETSPGLVRRQGPQDQQQTPLIHARTSSFRPDHGQISKKLESYKRMHAWSSSTLDEEVYPADFKHTGKDHHSSFRGLSNGDEKGDSNWNDDRPLHRYNTLDSIQSKEILFHPSDRRAHKTDANEINLSNRHHFSIREPRGFSLSRSHRRKPIARDWTTPRKRFVATITCITTSLLGLALGIYAGEVPAIQYTIGDEHHYTILGNVCFFLGLAASTILSWPLPVLHGRKPYTIVAVALLVPLQFPQALSVNDLRSPDDVSVRLGLLLPRAVSGIAMGFANINFMTTLLDLFGASLQSRNPHQEVVNTNDVRRHGGGMGAWLGIWTWCSTMSIGVGFLIGAGVISSGSNDISGSSSVAWGFWIVIIAAAFVLLLNVVVPETRRSAYRRSMAEVRTGTEVSRRVARGEIKMHLDQTGPKVWHEELVAGYRLTVLMTKQPGFLVLALYQGWIYGQIVLIIALLGALLSKYYHFHPQYVGLGVSIIPFGALFGVPFQIAGIFSRSRKTKQRTDSMTFEKQVTWSSHLVRRTVFTILLPLAGLGYTLASNGTVHYMVPILFAGMIGFLSTLAIAECNGLIMETFDTSDLQAGMTGRPRKNLPDEIKRKRTNFSCFPRVTAGFAIAQTFAFLIAAGATGWGGVIERHLGAQVATAVVAGILFILTMLLFAVLWRFKTVQIIPSQRYGTNVLSGPEDEWKPIIIGNPSGTTRRMSILELGNMSRWTEIRRRNKLGSVS